jgi:hypothetical protein
MFAGFVAGTLFEPGFLVIAGETDPVTGIGAALSAWESDRSRPLTALTWAPDTPLVTVTDPATPRVMARQWPEDCHPGVRPWESVWPAPRPTSASGIQSQPREAGGTKGCCAQGSSRFGRRQLWQFQVRILMSSTSQLCLPPTGVSTVDSVLGSRVDKESGAALRAPACSRLTQWCPVCG